MTTTPMMWTAAVLLALAPLCAGHAYLSHPASRNALHPLASCAHCMQAGGPTTVAQRGNNVWPTINAPTSHGLCGDPVQGAAVPASLADEPALVPGDPIATYTAGKVAEFSVAVSAHHMGHFEFRICDRALDGRTLKSAAEGQECLNQWVLERAPLDASCQGVTDSARPDCQPIDENHPGRWYLPPAGATTLHAISADSSIDQRAIESGVAEIYYMRYKIPSDLSCTHCTLQWYWSTGNSCLYDADYFTYFRDMHDAGWDAAAWSPSAVASWATAENTCCKAGRFTEEFWNCADVAVVGSSPGPAPPSPAPATTTATTTAAATAGPAPTPATTTSTPAPAPVSTSGAVSSTMPPSHGVHVAEPEPEPAPVPAPSPTTAAPTTAAPTTAATTTAATTTAAPSGCAEVWKQCGGATFKGPTCCVDGFVCRKQDQWYSQCVPAPAVALAQQASRKAVLPHHHGFLATALIQAGASLDRAEPSAEL